MCIVLNSKCVFNTFRCYSIDRLKMTYFSGLRLSITGPRLSPVSLLWLMCEPSQYGHCKNKKICKKLKRTKNQLDKRMNPDSGMVAKKTQNKLHLHSSMSSIDRKLPFRQYPQYRQNRQLWLRSNAPNGWHDLEELLVGHVDRMPNMTYSRCQRWPPLVELELPNRVLKHKN